MAKNKAKKLKARLPRGFADRDGADIVATSALVDKISAVYRAYGYVPVETPLFEYTDALGKFLPDEDRPNAGVFSLQDDDEQWMSLRYDLTAPLARHVAEKFNEIQTPYRTYRVGWVFRNEKPGPGRFRQFMQFDADVVGAPGVQADAEMAMMMADVMEAVGIARGDYVIRVNNRKVLDDLLAGLGLGGEDQAGQRLTVLRAIDKLDKFGLDGVQALLGEGRLDESGDFTKGAGLDEAQTGQVIAYLDGSVHGNGQGQQELDQIEQIVRQAGYDQNRIKIDASVVRGLEYYTGPVYEAELTFDVTNEKGQKIVFGSVGGGGRYDGLVSRFRGEPVPATGFSIGVSRLMTALKNLGRLEDTSLPAPILVTIMDRNHIADYAALAQNLRAGLNADGEAPVPVELYQGNPKNFGKQLQYADRRGCQLAIIQGEDERAAGLVTIKDLAAGKELSEQIDSNEEWRAARVAQVQVPVDELVAKVREILG